MIDMTADRKAEAEARNALLDVIDAGPGEPAGASRKAWEAALEGKPGLASLRLLRAMFELPESPFRDMAVLEQWSDPIGGVAAICYQGEPEAGFVVPIAIHFSADGYSRSFAVLLGDPDQMAELQEVLSAKHFGFMIYSEQDVLDFPESVAREVAEHYRAGAVEVMKRAGILDADGNPTELFRFHPPAD